VIGEDKKKIKTLILIKIVPTLFVSFPESMTYIFILEEKREPGRFPEPCPQEDCPFDNRYLSPSRRWHGDDYVYIAQRILVPCPGQTRSMLWVIPYSPAPSFDGRW
jgi:hypothetical protein